MAAAGMMSAGLVMMSSGGASAAPMGNNGTVKVAGLGDLDLIPDNEPHLLCQLTVQWYDFDSGADILSTVTFELQEPTGAATNTLSVDGPGQVFVGADDPTGAGNDFDGEQVYTLGFTGDPHPQQGYHVKLTIHTPHSKGADVKHKVFWVQPCETPTPTETVTATPTETPTETPTVTETVTPTETPTETGTETPTVTVSPTETETPVVTPSESDTETPVTVLPTESETTGTPSVTVLPTEIDSGMPGVHPSNGGARLLFGGGLLLLALALALVALPTTRGSHQV